MSARLRQIGLVVPALLLISADPVSPPSSHAVSQRDKLFLPGELTVKVGERVEFMNDDSVSHNVFSRTQGASFNLKLQQPGQRDEISFDEPGVVTVRCAIHPKMQMTIRVEQ